MILLIHKEMFDKLNIANIGNHFDSASNDRKNRLGKFGSSKSNLGCVYTVADEYSTVSKLARLGPPFTCTEPP